MVSFFLGLGYLCAAYHIIIHGKDFTLLKKTEITFNYTFYMIDNKKPERIMSIDPLRDAGIGDLLVDLDRLREWKKFELESKYDYEDEYE